MDAQFVTEYLPLYVIVKMVIIIEGITGPALTPVLSVIVWRAERQIEMILGPHKMLN